MKGEQTRIGELEAAIHYALDSGERGELLHGLISLQAHVDRDAHINARAAAYAEDQVAREVKSA
jgi:hypothetical protein